MNKTFRAWDVDQVWLLPPSLHDFVRADHPAHLVRELVRGELDLTAILVEYDAARGQPPYHPAMMEWRSCCTPTRKASTPRAGSRRRARSASK